MLNSFDSPRFAHTFTPEVVLELLDELMGLQAWADAVEAVANRLPVDPESLTRIDQCGNHLHQVSEKVAAARHATT